MAESERDAFVFLDRGGKRWPRLRLVTLLAALLAFVGLVLFVQSLLTMPRLQQPRSLAVLQDRLKKLQAQEAAKPADTKPIWLKAAPGQPRKGVAGGVHAGNGGKEIRLGFYAGWDPASLVSLKEHAGELTHLSPKWLTMVDGEGTLEVAVDDDVRELARDAGIVLMPRLDNLRGDTWLPEAVEGLLYGPPARREKFISEVVEQLTEAEAGGVIIDWCQLDPTYRGQVTSLLLELATVLHQRGMQLWFGVPVGDELRAFDLEALAPVVDRFVGMLHDENSEYDEPGPIASQPWFEGWLKVVTSYGRPEQWVISLGTYGYDWPQGGKADFIGFADAMARAGRAGVRCSVKPPYGNPFFSYVEENRRHTVWFLDAVSFANQLLAVRRLGLGGVAIFQLGTEDPAIWQTLKLPVATTDRRQFAFLQSMPAGELIANLGRGDFIRVEDARADGARDVRVTADGAIASRYLRFPSYLTVTHQGEGTGDQVAITFDDGPDARWTPRILDILKERQVKAAFFMVGNKMEDNPELVRRMLAEGHEVGVHTYYHPDLAEVSAERALLELNATQRLLEKIAGRSTLLFRPPYNADSRPANEAGIIPVQIAQGLGYLTVGHSIDPKDWQKPGTEELLERVKAGRAFGRVILLHDAGGDRRQTVEALPAIIDYLETRGDRIVPLGALIGLESAALMPPPAYQSPFARLVSERGFSVLHSLEKFLWAFMIVATILVALRTFAVIGLAMRQRRASVAAGGFAPPVSVMIAAYNEEKVIASTLTALLRSDYEGGMEIIVVDDGSTDGTAEEVEAVSRRDDRVRLIRQENLGKARALRAGLAAARHEIVVTLDADTQFQPDTVRELVAPLNDPGVGAVSGHAKVGNRRTFIARCQDLEYTCGFNLDRRAYHHLNCITVVPGAVSALRKSAVLSAGGISTDTLAEDTDLTLCLHRLGYRVAYAPAAIAWTEAPERFASLARQRFRWAFGTLQCLWKHRDLVFSGPNRALGWFSLPGLWFFQIVLVAVGPLVDAFLVSALFAGGGLRIALFIGFFLGMDLLLAVLACRLEPEPLRNAWRIVPMRFVYRPLLSWVVWKSLVKAGKGVWVGWGKQERSGSVTMPSIGNG
ncbi:MAG: glycosyltransferase [Thermodesulfobacteriota bacterium]